MLERQKQEVHCQSYRVKFRLMVRNFKVTCYHSIKGQFKQSGPSQTEIRGGSEFCCRRFHPRITFWRFLRFQSINWINLRTDLWLDTPTLPSISAAVTLPHSIISELCSCKCLLTSLPTSQLPLYDSFSRQQPEETFIHSFDKYLLSTWYVPGTD